MTERIRPITPDEINDIVARARAHRAEAVSQLFKAGFAAVKGWFRRAPKTKPARRHGPLAGANA